MIVCVDNGPIVYLHLDHHIPIQIYVQALPSRISFPCVRCMQPTWLIPLFYLRGWILSAPTWTLGA